MFDMYVYIGDLHFDNVCTPSSLQNFTKHGGKVKSPDGSASESGPKETKAGRVCRPLSASP